MQSQTNRAFVKVIIDGRELKLSERTARDQYVLSQDITQSSGDKKDVYLYLVMLVYQGLKINLKELKWYEFIKKIKIKRIINPKNLFFKLSFSQLNEYAEKIVELENRTVKKKTQPADQSQE